MAIRSRSLMAMLLFLALSTVSRSRSTQGESFYDVLGANALPIGLFPKGISNFSLDPSSGSFRVQLLSPSPCHAKFETRVRYQGDISGKLSYGRISNLTGVAAEELFLWLPVRGIQVDIPSSGLIYFDIGVVSKQFSLSFFETPKDCSDAGDADDEQKDSVFFDGDRPRIIESQSGDALIKRSIDRKGDLFHETEDRTF